MIHDYNSNKIKAKDLLRNLGEKDIGLRYPVPEMKPVWLQELFMITFEHMYTFY